MSADLAAVINNWTIVTGGPLLKLKISRTLLSHLALPAVGIPIALPIARPAGAAVNANIFSVAIFRFFHTFFISFVPKERKQRIVIVTYSVIETGSKQYRVAAGDTLEIERLPVEAGQVYTFDRVLLVSHDGKVSVGSPTVVNATVVADVVAHKRGPKLIAFKMRRREGYHRKVGHRQELTVVKIKEIKA